MASYDFQVVLNNANNLPRDRYVNTLYYDTGSGGPEPVMDGIHQAYASNLLNFHSGEISSMTINAYPPGLNPGGPAESKRYAYDPGNVPGPAEVALCLSYFADTNRPRNRGRIFLGPIAAGDMSAARPSAAILGVVLNFGKAIAAIGGLTTRNWLQHSRVDGSYSAVTDFYVDNAWDTQRRRGAVPTTRLTGTI